MLVMMAGRVESEPIGRNIEFLGGFGGSRIDDTALLQALYDAVVVISVRICVSFDYAAEIIFKSLAVLHYLVNDGGIGELSGPRMRIAVSCDLVTVLVEGLDALRAGHSAVNSALGIYSSLGSIKTCVEVEGTLESVLVKNFG